MADPRDRIELEVLALLRSHSTEAFRPKELAKTLGYTDNRRFGLFREVLDALASAGRVETEKGRVRHRPARREAVGVLQVSPQGHGFVTAEGFPDDLYVPPDRLGTALDGDRVRVALAAAVRPGDPARGVRLREAEVVEVVHRTRTSAVGTFERMGHFAFVRPDDARLHKDIYVDAEGFNGAKEKDKVVVSIDAFDDPRAVPEGRVLEVIGPADDPRVAVLALAMARGIRATFPAPVEAEAEAIPVEIPPGEVARRLDLRQARVFTIDPADAKDFDDAVHVRPLTSGNLEVGVHIADVSHYVRDGTALDEEAYRRGTSTYLVDRTIPMLPEKLSNGVCSLRPREDKLTFSVIMEVTPRGTVKGYEIRESVIHSHQRFSYEDAQAVLDGAEHDFAGDVRLANDLARALTRKRMKEGAIDFDTPEVRVVLDDRGAPVEVIRKERRDSNRLIEELMLLANRTVAEHVGKRLKRPLMYRVHDAPNAEKIGTLAEYVRAFGYHLTVDGGAVSREALNRLLHHFKGTPEDVVIATAAIQAMAKAVYSPDNIGHYGLGFRYYAHFTSPIRRYPDLVVHRLLKRYAAADLDGVSEDQLRVQGKHLSDREREATEAERDSVRLKQVEYAARHLGDVFEGVVVGVTKFGAFVELTRLLVEGLVHVRDMEDDFWEYDPRRYALVGQNTRRTIRLGQEVRVQVVAASPALKRVDLRFVTDGEGARADGAAVGAGRDRRRDGKEDRERKGRREKLRKGGAQKGGAQKGRRRR